MSDIFFCLCCRYKREPNWFGLAILVCDDLDTLSVVELIVEWYDSTVDLGDRDRIAEVGVDRICKIYRSRTLWECDDITTRGEYEYLIFEHIHLHLVHELAPCLVCIDDSFDGLDPVAVFGFLTLARLRVLKMGRNSDLRLTMHLDGAYLDLGRLRPEIRK